MTVARLVQTVRMFHVVEDMMAVSIAKMVVMFLVEGNITVARQAKMGKRFPVAENIMVANLIMIPLGFLVEVKGNKLEN